MTAGRSAEAEREHGLRLAEELRRQARIATARAAAFGSGGRGEAHTARELRALGALGFAALHDRHWPGTRRSNIDHLVVGPSGVFVIDSKNWSGTIQASGGALLCDGESRDDEVDKLLRQARTVEELLADEGLAPLEVVPVMALTRASGLSERLGRAHVVSSDRLLSVLAHRGERLTGEQVSRLAARLDAECPPAEAPEEPSPVAPPVVVPHQPTEDDGLFDLDDLDRTALAAAAREPIEEWMTFLHPAQVRIVRRSYSGPSRIRGPAGTGKTVVALHRAAYLAATRPGPILFASFVRTLPEVLASLFRRMAPDLADRVEFVGLHRWASALLRDRGVPFDYDPEKAETCFSRAFSDWAGRARLETPSTPVSYWKDEIDAVIKGRGLRHFEDYAALQRTGRKTRLPEGDRASVWELYDRYNALLRERGVVDSNDLLDMASQSVRQRPPEPGYGAVIADEVQDLNLLGARLLHALVGDRPDGLTLVGDGQQAIYPGGYTLAEAGISVAGRAAVLRANYRNTRPILEYATRLVADDDFADLDAELERGRREVTVLRDDGPAPVEVAAPVERHPELLAEAVLADVSRGLSPGDAAVLVPTNQLAGRYARVLRDAGLAIVSLEDYDGTASGRVKVGTLKRAKGLEFAAVYLPEVRLPEVSADADPALVERAELERRERFVAMSRARDHLWVALAEPARPPGPGVPAP